MEELTPERAAALVELGELPHERLPMLAAHWLASGRDGEALRELAGLHGREPEVWDLWPDALAEVGVVLPVQRPRRTAISWAAAQVVGGVIDVRQFLRLLWPDHTAPDDELDLIIWSIDDRQDYADDCLAGRGGRRPEDAEEPLAEVRAAIEALARDDLAAALAALG